MILRLLPLRVLEEGAALLSLSAYVVVVVVMIGVTGVGVPVLRLRRRAAVFGVEVEGDIELGGDV